MPQKPHIKFKCISDQTGRMLAGTDDYVPTELSPKLWRYIVISKPHEEQDAEKEKSGQKKA